MHPPAPFTLTMQSDLRHLAVLRSFVEAVCQVGGFAPETTGAVVLAVHEAASNVIRHAHRDRPGAEIQVQCRLVADGIEVQLQDEGDPFDLAAVPDLDPAELRIGGRGVFLMRSLMDELSCRPRDQRGNTLRMVKHCGRRLALSDAG